MSAFLRPLLPLAEAPAFVDAFARVVADSAAQVCAECGLERMGHAPESAWLGYAPHGWRPRPATAADVATARRLTAEAYARREVTA